MLNRLVRRLYFIWRVLTPAVWPIYWRCWNSDCTIVKSADEQRVRHYRKGLTSDETKNFLFAFIWVWQHFYTTETSHGCKFNCKVVLKSCSHSSTCTVQSHWLQWLICCIISWTKLWGSWSQMSLWSSTILHRSTDGFISFLVFRWDKWCYFTGVLCWSVLLHYGFKYKYIKVLLVPW